VQSPQDHTVIFYRCEIASIVTSVKSTDRRTLLVGLASGGILFASGCLGGQSESAASSPTEELPDSDDTAAANPTGTQTDSIDAVIETTMGDISIELYHDRVPNTVNNFVGLATGRQAWIDPETGEEISEEPLYTDVLFHRVIDGFMIQTGDPTGTGRGGPGYRFEDEFHESLRHDGPGVLSMANSGPDTNGSQFFITLGEQPHLDDRHAVFGRVTDGMDVVNNIGSVETDDTDRPREDVFLTAISIE